MRIREIHVHQHDLPVVGGPFRMARTTVDALDTTIVRVVTDTGHVGWGETCPVGPVYQAHHALGARAALAEVAPGLIGQDARAIEVVRSEMDARLDGHAYAKAAIDIALWDLAGKLDGRRVCELLGGGRRERVPAYHATSVGEPEQVAREAREKVAAGFRRIQIKVGGRAVERDVATLRKVWEAVADEARLVADANRGWTGRDAMLFSNACADIPLCLEQPCNSLDEIAAVRRHLCHPVYLDESAEDLASVLRALTWNACDGLALKLTRAGGLSAMRTIRDVCAARGIPQTSDDSWGGDIVAAACVHLAATVPERVLDGVWLATPYIREAYDPAAPVTIRDGHAAVPDGPGLGLTLDPATFGEPVASYG